MPRILVSDRNGASECSLFLKANERICIMGYGSVKVIQGEISIHGYDLTKDNEWTEIFSPDTSSPLLIETGTATAGVTKSFASHEDSKLDQVQEVCIVFREGDRFWSDMASFLDMKDLWGNGPLMKSLKIRFPSIVTLFPTLHIIIPENQVAAAKTMTTVMPTVETQWAPSHCPLATLPLWKSLGDFLLEKLKEAEKQKVVRNRNDRLSVIVFGNKRSGKSTLVKYLINRMLSCEKVVPYVLLANLDCGQSELTPPGIISLHKIKNPTLGNSSFTAIREPMKKEFVGAVSISENPLEYLQAVESLLRNVLVGDEEEESDDDNAALKTAPLLVNTMGWVTGLGLELFKSIVDIVSPQYIVPLVEGIATSQDLLQNNQNYVEDFLKTIYNTDDSFSLFKGDKKHVIRKRSIILPTSAYSAPSPQSHNKYAPRDLRNLALAAYFSGCHKRNGTKDRSGIPEVFRPVFCTLPFVVPFKQVKIIKCNRSGHVGDVDVLGVSVFNCTVVGLFEMDLFVGLGYVRGIDADEEVFHIVSPLSSLQSITHLKRSKINISVREFSDAFVKAIPSIVDIEMIGSSARKARYNILRKRCIP